MKRTFQPNNTRRKKNSWLQRKNEDFGWKTSLEKKTCEGQKEIICINYEMGRLSRPILLYEAGANRFGTRTNAQKKHLYAGSSGQGP